MLELAPLMYRNLAIKKPNKRLNAQPLSRALCIMKIASNIFVAILLAGSLVYFWYLATLFWEIYKPYEGDLLRSGTHLYWALQGGLYIFVPASFILVCIYFWLRKFLTNKISKLSGFFGAILLGICSVTNAVYLIPSY